MKVMHLNQYEGGRVSKTACNRAIPKSHLSTKWSEFKTDSYKCHQCATSKQSKLFQKLWGVL